MSNKIPGNGSANVQYVLNLGKTLTKTAQLYPNSVGLIQGDQQWTWNQLNMNVNALGAGLSGLGVQKGDFVFVLTPNNRCGYETIYALAKLGAIDVPLNFRITAEELISFSRTCPPKLIIVHEDYIDLALQLQEANACIQGVIVFGNLPVGFASANWYLYDDLIQQNFGADITEACVTHDDTMRVIFSAGTTGKPKALMNSFGQLAYTVTNRLADVMVGVSPDDAFLAIGPLSHGSSTVVLINTACAARIVFLSKPSADEEEIWHLIESHHITSLFLVPTLLMRLVRHPARLAVDHSSLKHVVYAGAPITRVDQREAYAALGDCLIQYYGSGESMGHGTVLKPSMHSLRDDDPLAPPGSVGVARTGTDLEILDENLQPVPIGDVGQLCIRRGPGVFSGFYGDVATTEEMLQGEWLVTGDLARMDARGFVYIVGRTKEMYKSGGLQVFPNETEDFLSRHDAVAEAFVIPFPDQRWGEIGVAVVRLHDSHTATEDELKVHLRESLSGYKIPKRIFIWDEIPKSTVGKAAKHQLRQEIYRRGLAVAGKDVTDQ